METHSATALYAATMRAAHLELDEPPWIFEDRLARRLLGDEGDVLRELREDRGEQELKGVGRWQLYAVKS